MVTKSAAEIRRERLIRDTHANAREFDKRWHENRMQEHDVSVLRAHAIAGVMRQCRPPAKGAARAAWWDCVRHLAGVVCSKEGMSVCAFHHACGDTD